MDPASRTIFAELVTEKKRIPIVAKCASKYSFLIRSLDDVPLRDGAEFPSLLVQNDGDSVQMGKCRIMAEPNEQVYNRRLIFIDDVYDLESLISKNEIIRLQGEFMNLPLVLAHKDKIRQSFRDYTADLSYDLSVYKELFDRLDKEYRQEPVSVRNLVQRAIIDTEGRKFMRFLDERLAELQKIVSDFTKEEHERHGFYFRKQLWNYILCAPFMARTNQKPRGYAGDSKMMTMVYSNEYEGHSTFSKLMHKHPVEHPAAQAVRNRRKLMADRICTLAEKYGTRNGEKMKILSVACGPVCEIEDIIGSSDDLQRYEFTLLDQDRKAFSEAANVLNLLENKYGTAVPVRFLNESVRTMLAIPELKSKWGQFDFIYSMGLFDYLTPPVGRAVLTKLYHLLQPEGEMVIGNFHTSNPSKRYMEYWLDWTLYYRTEKEFAALLNGTCSADTHLTFDDTGVQMLLHVKKRQT